MILSRFSLFVCSLTLLLLTACQSWRYQKITDLPSLISEASGLYIAASDSCWWLNDSGGQASVYATNLNGEILDSIPIPGAKNVDWEDMTIDDEGYLYLCDIGNNRNQRQDLVIYKWRPGMKQATQIHLRYPDQSAFPPPASQLNFDAEACFWYQDSLYIFSKNRSNYFTKLYALPATPGSYTATLKDSLDLGDRIVTAAAIHPEGGEIALLTYDFRGKLWPFRSSVFLLSAFRGTNFLDGSVYRQEIPPLRLGRQFEAIDYQDADHLLIATEASPISPAFVIGLSRRKKK
ncbi:MAG: hypothetical protein AAFO91_10770 [Bacteroidota bacterium]